jgi:hypothetical protein
LAKLGSACNFNVGGKIMSSEYPPVRTEPRTPQKVTVELHNPENASYEIASTVNVSLHGARILTKGSWVPNQDLSIRSVPGDLFSRARIVYYRPLPDGSFSIGLQLYLPTEDWPKADKPPATPRPQ